MFVAIPLTFPAAAEELHSLRLIFAVGLSDLIILECQCSLKVADSVTINPWTCVWRVLWLAIQLIYETKRRDLLLVLHIGAFCGRRLGVVVGAFHYARAYRHPVPTRRSI